MEVRNSISLKFFALLLFVFELLAPVALTESAQNTDSDTHGLHASIVHGWSVALALLCEEAGSENEEEREGKDHKVLLLPEVNFMAVFQFLSRQSNIVNPQFYFSKMQAGVSLLALIGTYRI